MRPGAIDLRQLDSRLRGNDEISRSPGGRRNVGCKLTLANTAKAQAAQQRLEQVLDELGLGATSRAELGGDLLLNSYSLLNT